MAVSVERGTVFETLQLGVEATPGVRVAALKRLLCTMISFEPQIPVNPYRPSGSLAPTTATGGKEWTQGSLSGAMCFNDLVYLAASNLCAPVITTPGGATNTRRWTFKPNNFTPNNVKTYTAEKGSWAGAERALYLLINSLGMVFNTTESTVNGAVLGKALDYTAHMSTNEVQQVNLGGASGGTFDLTFAGQTAAANTWNITAANLQTALEGLSTIGSGNILVTLVSAGIYNLEFVRALGQTNVAAVTGDFTSLTGATGAAATTTTPGVPPTDVPEKPVSASKISIYMGPDVAGLARVRRVDSLEWACNERFASVFDLQDDEASFEATVEKGPALSSQLVMQRNTDAVTLIGYLRSLTTRMCRVTVISADLVEAGFPYRIQLTFPFKIRDPRHGSAQEVETAQLELFPVYDSTFAGWVELVVDNALTAL